MPVCPVHDVEMVLATPHAVRHSTSGAYPTKCPEPDCDVFCGASPYSMPAPRVVLRLRHQAHQVFDVLWSEHNPIFSSRTSAYRWLATTLDLDREACHFGKFSAQQCEDAIWHIQSLFGHVAPAELEPELKKKALPLSSLETPPLDLFELAYIAWRLKRKGA